MCSAGEGSDGHQSGGIEAVVHSNALKDPHVTFVIAYLDPTTVTLGEAIYVMDANTVLELGSHSPSGTDLEVGVFLSYPPRPGSRSRPYACQLNEMATRLFPSAGVPQPVTPAALVPAAKRTQRGFEGEQLGHLAELEVVRLLGVPAALNTFKSFPDLEETEYLVRHRPTGAIRGCR